MKMTKRLMSLFLCAIMMLSLSVSALATSNDHGESNLREPLETERTDDPLYDSCELEKGTMYLKENSEYRIAYIVFDEGYISYAICYKDDPSVSHTGYYYPNEQNQLSDEETDSVYFVEPDAGNNSIVELLLTLEPENTIDFASRATMRVNSITTEAEALQFAEQWAPGWKTPINSRLIGQSWEYPVRVDLYEHVNGYCTERNVVNYYVRDSLTAIASLVFGLNTTKIQNVVTNAFDGVSDYIAQRDGTLSYFKIDNTRTKTARIDGDSWYWAGWDRTYCVYSGDKDTRVEQIWDYAHFDYDNDISYFADKAYYSYTHPY